jgi:hypothetical protein
MRFALIATTAAAAVAVPLAMAAAGPQMSRDEFLSAVRCTAYEDISSTAQLGVAKFRLNAEARRQDAQTAAEARAEVSAVARQALNGAAGLATMCAEGQRADGAAAAGSV